MLALLLLLLLFPPITINAAADHPSDERFQPFQDPDEGEFGLLDTHSAHANPCLLLKLRARFHNFNLNGTDIAVELADFTDPSVKLHGFCALSNEQRKSSQLIATWRTNERHRALRFTFREAHVKLRVKGSEEEQLRWQLESLIYKEQFKGRSVIFSSSDSSSSPSTPWEANSSALVISAPLNQKFLCQDRLNVSMYNPDYKKMVAEFLPEIDVQPVNTGTGFGSNIYVCERTRRRTLAESFQSRITIFSGVVLGASSVSVMIGYGVKRQLHRQAMLEGGGASQKIYGSF